MHEFVLLAVPGLAIPTLFGVGDLEMLPKEGGAGVSLVDAACMACAGESAQPTAWIQGEGGFELTLSPRDLSSLASGSSSTLVVQWDPRQVLRTKPPGLHSSPRLCNGDSSCPMLATVRRIFLIEQMNCWDAQSPLEQAALVNTGDGVGDRGGPSRAASHWAASLHHPLGH